MDNIIIGFIYLAFWYWVGGLVAEKMPNRDKETVIFVVIALAIFVLPFLINQIVGAFY